MKIKPVLSARQLTPLIEILIIISFFAGASVILVQVFAKAYNDSRLAHDINSATLFVGECAERMRASDYNKELDFLPEFEKNSDGVYRVHLDNDFAVMSGNNAYAEVRFEVGLDETEPGKFLTGQFVCMRSDGVELIKIKTAVFYGGNP